MPYTAAIRNGWMDGIFNVTNYISLHSGDPGATGLNELSGNGYARQDGTSSFPASSAGALANDVVITFGPANTANWAQATYFGIWTALTGGTFKGGFLLTTPQTVQVPNTAAFGVGALTASAS